MFYEHIWTLDELNVRLNHEMNAVSYLNLVIKVCTIIMLSNSCLGDTQTVLVLA